MLSDLWNMVEVTVTTGMWWHCPCGFVVHFQSFPSFGWEPYSTMSWHHQECSESLNSEIDSGIVAHIDTAHPPIL